ncbi:hypothetical protein PENTCL1PPCAC_16667, partial [Pristionchus entomophagus]
EGCHSSHSVDLSIAVWSDEGLHFLKMVHVGGDCHSLIRVTTTILRDDFDVQIVSENSLFVKRLSRDFE